MTINDDQQMVRRRMEKRSSKQPRSDYSKRMLVTEKNELATITFLAEHDVKIADKITELRAKPEIDRQKCVAFAMGHHKRLGVNSLMAQMDPEVLRMVLEQSVKFDYGVK